MQGQLPGAGWYVDPGDQTRWRYWDGLAWCSEVASRAELDAAAVGNPLARAHLSGNPTRATVGDAGRALGRRATRPLRPWWQSPVVWILALLVAGAGAAAWATQGDTIDSPVVTVSPVPSPS